ncbi:MULTISPECIES: YunC family protein [unclassified Metabacillus]|uniref:YunC family protein n=1 Tax=Metabacillus sp. JX24 TaxID=3240759 RepID=UPI0030FDC1CC
MVSMTPIMIGSHQFTAITVALPKTNFMAVTSDKGYIMCGALDVALLNEKLKERGIIAGRAVGVRTIEQLLDAPLESITFEAENRGIHVGMSGRDALLRMI